MTTTYPMMWPEVKRALDEVDETSLAGINLSAYLFIKNEYKNATKKRATLSVNGATKDNRFHSFGDNSRNKNTIQYSVSGVWDYVAVKFAPSVTTSNFDDDQYTFDESYLAFRAGNWNLSIGMQDKWWGGGWDSNLGLTNNARPMPAITLSRTQALPFNVPFTDYQLPWTVTTYMAQMEEERHVPNTLLWGFRATVMPFDNFEFSVSRLAQWAGDGRPSDFDTFVDLFLGRDNCGKSGFECGDEAQAVEPGNQQAGFDVRYSFNAFSKPITLYANHFGEDGGGDKFISRAVNQVGMDMSFNWFNQYQKVYIEYADTFKVCANTNGWQGPDRPGDCFYEHHIYQTGMRYKARNIGHLYDNDTTSIVAGIVNQDFNETVWTAKVRYLEINNDNSARYPDDPNKGHTLSKISEDVIMLSGDYQKRLAEFTYKIGASVSQSSFIDLPSETDYNLFFQIKRDL
ncbi:capsule assembly Wzi family protein [Thalassomonas sp. M1454]|uniref:capsule assembly Wzi family protein n=1 Tax=Thalassomonas sp. M1454 TaxID=2594477 RepID=UPI00163DDE73|nr:capsule assembly Wzi family protein [Thalassomonas sp. M1454]